MSIGAAKLVTIPMLAKALGIDRVWMWTSLKRLAARDEQETGSCDWLLRYHSTGKIWINTSRLRVAHPAIFEARATTRDDLEGLAERVRILEDEQKRLKQRQNAVGASMRVVQSEVRSLRTVVTGESGSPSQ